MSAEIIPPGDNGSFTITDRMLMENDAVSIGAFEILLYEEAYRRGLNLTVAQDQRTFDIIVTWRK